MRFADIRQTELRLIYCRLLNRFGADAVSRRLRQRRLSKAAIARVNKALSAIPHTASLNITRHC